MRAWVMAAVLLLVSGAFGAVQAQALPPGAGWKPAAAAPAVPDNLKPAEVDGFVAGLTDAQSRQVLLDRLRQSASAAEPREPDAMLDFAGMLRAARDAAARLGERTEQALAALPGAPDALAKAFELMTDLEGTAALPMAGLALLTMLLVGAALEWLVRRRFSARIERDPTSDGLAHRTALMLCASDVIAIVLFGLGAFLTSFAFFERFHPMREALIAAVILIVVVRLAYALARLLLGTQTAGPAQALPPLQVSMVVGFVAFGAVSLGLLKLYGFPPELLTLCQAAWARSP